MNNFKRPVRIPQEMRDTVTALQINLTALVQRYIDSFRFYPYFCTRTHQQKLNILSTINYGFVKFQRGGNIYFDPVLTEVNERYGQLLIELSNNKKLTSKAHDNQSAILIETWEKEVRPLIIYPKEVPLSEGGMLRIHFNFLLCHLNSSHDIRRLFYIHMKRIALANVYAYDYPGNSYNNNMLKKFFEGLRGDSSIFLPRTGAQTSIVGEYEKKLADLLAELSPTKNYYRRNKAFRLLIKEWAGRMEGIKPIL